MQTSYWWRKQDDTQTVCQVRLRPGQTCSQCHKGVLAYDGLFVLTCPVCGYAAESGAFS